MPKFRIKNISICAQCKKIIDDLDVLLDILTFKTEIEAILATNSSLPKVCGGFAAAYEANRGLFDMNLVLPPFFSGRGQTQGRLLDLGCGAGEPFPEIAAARP